MEYVCVHLKQTFNEMWLNKCYCSPSGCILCVVADSHVHCEWVKLKGCAMALELESTLQITNTLDENQILGYLNHNQRPTVRVKLQRLRRNRSCAKAVGSAHRSGANWHSAHESWKLQNAEHSVQRWHIIFANSTNSTGFFTHGVIRDSVTPEDVPWFWNRGGRCS